MKYVVIKTGGKQYKVSEGDIIEVERLSPVPNEAFGFSEVLLYAGEGLVKIGNPFLSDVKVSGVILEHTKGNKIRVAKYKAKVRYRRVMGHRQSLTKVRIDAISTSVAKGKRDDNVAKEEKNPVKSTKTRSSRKILEKTA